MINSILNRLESPKFPILILFILTTGMLGLGFGIVQNTQRDIQDSIELSETQICQAYEDLSLALRAVVEATKPVPEQFGELTDDEEVRRRFEQATQSNEFFRRRALRILDGTECPISREIHK